METWQAIIIVIEVLMTLAITWLVMHEDRVKAVERYYWRKLKGRWGK